MQYRRAFSILALAAVTTVKAGPSLAQVPAPAPQSTEAPPQNVARLQNFGTLVSFLNLASGAVRLLMPNGQKQLL